MDPNTDIKIELEVFSGPLDLLLYLVKRSEVEIYDIPIASIADQYIKYLERARALDINLAGDFLVLASTLMEIKSRLLLPVEEAQEEEVEDPRSTLVQELLEYKRFKEVSRRLAARELEWVGRYGRQTLVLEEEGDELAEIGRWDLLTAYVKLSRAILSHVGPTVAMEDVPIETYMERVMEMLSTRERILFDALVASFQGRESLVGLFLAVLELVRNRRISIFQESLFGEIVVEPVREAPPEGAAAAHTPEG